MTLPPLHLTAHILEFTVRARTPLEVSAWPGSALRGALLGVLRRHYCPVPQGESVDHATTCPVCWLMVREDPRWWRGHQPVRPYTIAAVGGQGTPLDTGRGNGARYHRLEPGDTFTFRMTLFGVAVHLLPYLVLAVPVMGKLGLGRKLAELGRRRGEFELQRIEALHPFREERQTLFVFRRPTVEMPRLTITADDVAAETERLLGSMSNGRLVVEFHTPTRLVDQGKLLKVPHFRPLFQRTLERVEGLTRLYAEQPVEWDYRELLAAAENVRLLSSQVTWVELKSGSRRTGRVTPLSGFIGRATYAAEDWRRLLPVLLWGSITQIGKDTVKGNGWIRVSLS